jgi:hypothetical protein
VSSTDVIVCTAAERAADDEIYSEPRRLEAQLVGALHRQLEHNRGVGTPRTECRFALPGWTRPPGGVDLSVSLARDTGSLVIEAKVGKPDEAIWDVIKLADILALDRTIIAAYLVYDATLSLNPPC